MCLFSTPKVFVNRSSVIKNKDYQAISCNLKENETSRNLQYDLYKQNLHELRVFIFVLPNTKPLYFSLITKQIIYYHESCDYHSITVFVVWLLDYLKLAFRTLEMRFNDVVLVLLLLTLNIFHTFFECFYCWL